MLLELSSEYMRFLSLQTLKEKKKNLQAMNELLEQQGISVVTKKAVRSVYERIFARHLELIVASDPKKPEKLMAAIM